MASKEFKCSVNVNCYDFPPWKKSILVNANWGNITITHIKSEIICIFQLSVLNLYFLKHG